MRTGTALIVGFLLAFAVSGTALSSTDAPPSVNAGADKREGDTSRGLDGIDALPAGGCPDIAYSEIFRSKGLGYVSSPEFALAVRAVANGASKYSPDEIPPDWRATAASWGGFRAAHAARHADSPNPTVRVSLRGPEGLQSIEDSESCSPSLIYLASMEYRSKVGLPGLTPVFPVFLREATRDLAARADAKRQLAGKYKERMAVISAKVRDAERMGAEDCAPGRLAEVKADLNRARREAATIRSSVQETESCFLKAERIADTLVARQRLALKKGLRCYTE